MSSADVGAPSALPAIYGAAGSVVRPRVAERLGAPLLDREIREAVARETGLPAEAIADVDQKPRSGMERLLASLGRASTMSGGTGQQRMALEGIDLDTARRRQALEDRARVDYVRRAYGVDGFDPALYHLILDSTAIDLEACVELVVAASHSRIRNPRPSLPD